MSHIEDVSVIVASGAEEMKRKLREVIRDGYELTPNFTSVCDGMGKIYLFQVVVKLKEKPPLLNE